MGPPGAAFTRLGHELANSGVRSGRRRSPRSSRSCATSATRAPDARRRRGSARSRPRLIRSAANGDELCAAIHGATGLDGGGPERAGGGTAGVRRRRGDSARGAGRGAGGGRRRRRLIRAGRRQPPDRVRWWASVPIGSASWRRARLRADPPTVQELAAAREQIAAGARTVRRAAAGRWPSRSAAARRRSAGWPGRCSTRPALGRSAGAAGRRAVDSRSRAGLRSIPCAPAAAGGHC